MSPKNYEQMKKLTSSHATTTKGKKGQTPSSRSGDNGSKGDKSK
jgi:hypothetical protein